MTVATNLYLGDFLVQNLPEDAPRKVDAGFVFNFSGIVITAMSFVAAFYLAFVALDVFWVRKQIQDDKDEIFANKQMIDDNSTELEKLQTSLSTVIESAETFQTNFQADVDSLQSGLKSEERDITALSESIVDTVIRLNNYATLSGRAIQTLSSKESERDPKAIKQLQNRQTKSLAALEFTMAQVKLNLFGVFPSLWDEYQRPELKKDALTIARSALEADKSTDTYEKYVGILRSANQADPNVVSDRLLRRTKGTRDDPED